MNYGSRVGLVMLLLAPELLSAQAHRGVLVIAPAVAYQSFTGDSRLHPALAFGTDILYSPSTVFSLGVRLQTSVHSSRYDTPGQTAEAGVRSMSLSLIFQSVLFAAGRWLKISANAGVGVLDLSTSSREISLGALGRTTIPARAERSGLLSLGTRFSVFLMQHLHLFVEPGLSFITPLAAQHSYYQLSGGIEVDIF
jgi:hypothetical protein